MASRFAQLRAVRILIGGLEGSRMESRMWRQARAAAGACSAVSSESDASPIRRYAGRKAEGVQ